MNMRNHDADITAARSPFRLKPLVHAVQLALLPGLVTAFASIEAEAAPSGGQVRAGSAHISHDAAHGVTTVKQNTPRTAIDWQSFNVAKGEQVRFKQPNAKAVALNRIFDQKPSQIFGQVKANGQVVLLNPNGVFFRPGAEVNVGGLIAGAMRVGVDEFMSGRYVLKAEDGSDGRVLNQGRITAADGGDVALIGKTVANEGAIVATAGRVNLLAGDQTTVDFDGDGLLRFKVDKAVVDNAAKLDEQISNSGQISADGGQILITARAAAGVFDQAINNAGVIKAGRIEKRGGKIMLVGSGPTSSVLNTGSIDASAASDSDDGGRISVRANEVDNRGTLAADATHGQGGSIAVAAVSKASFNAGSTVTATSTRGKGGSVEASAAQLAFNFDAAVDVSGRTGGGTALLGGDLHGANPDIDNAERVFVGSQVSIKADASGHGDGGKVVVWADDSTRFHGKISARGGARGGDGGQVEVSGKQTLDFVGEVDTSAPRGKAGELLLDPSTLTITDANANTGSLDTNISNADADISGDADAGGNTISWGKIDSLAVTTNIVLEATGLVTINDVTGGAPAITTTNNAVHLDLTTGSLTIRSTGGNVVFADQNDIIETKGGAVTLSAAAGTVTAGGVKTNVSGGNGAVTIISGTGGSFGDITTGGALFTANVGAGTATQVAGKTLIGSTALTKTGLGALTLSEANSHIGATTVSQGTLNVTNAAGLGTTNGGTTVASGAVLVLDNVSIGSEALTLGGGTLRALGTANVDGNITLTDNSAIDVPGSELILGGVISGAGFGIDKKGTGSLTLNNASSYSGTTTITDGSIVVGVDNVFANSILNIAAGQFSMETTNQTVVGLAGSGLVSNDEPSANAVTFTINGGAGQTFSGTFFDNTADDISVVKTGAGTQTFSVGASTYAGSLTIDDGTLSITTANSLGDAVAGTTVSNNGTLDLNNLALASTEAIDISDSGISNVGALTATGTSSIGATNILTMGANATIGGSGTLTLNTALDNGGSRALTKTGSGTLVLAADNSAAFTSATGTITINAGAIKVTDVGGLGDTVGGTTIANDAQLEFALGGNASVAENLSFEGNGGANGAALLHSSANVLTLTGSLTLTNVGLANDATISVSNAGGVMSVGAISDGAATLSLTKVGSGALLMTAAQTYNGVTHVNAGTLRAGLADVLAAGAGLDLGATGVFNLAGFDQSLAKLDGAAGALVTNDVGGTADIATLTITGGGGSYAGDITENGSDTLSLVKSGTGTQSLSVASGSYDGGTSITGGTLSILTEASLGTGSGATTANGGTLELNGVSLTGSETIHLSGSGNGGVGALTGIGAVSVESGNSVVLDADTSVGGAGTLTINAVISESGGARALTKLGAGTVVLGGNNSYTGATTVNAGTLEAGAVDVLDNSSGVNLAVSGARLNLAGFDQTLKKLDGVTGTVATNDAGSTADVATLTINAGGGNFAGNLTENGSDALTLTKSGSGTQILSGSGNTYTGNTIVSGGTLQAGADNVLGAGDLNVSLAGATFNLAGFDQTVDELDGIAGAIVTNDAGNTADIATLTVTGSGTYAGDITENGSDTLSLAKTTGGILTLSVGTGTFDGAVTITGGAISITTAASLGTATAGTVVNGGTLSLANFALASSESLSLAGTGGGSGALQSGAGVSSIAASNAITLTGNATIGTAGLLTINSVIAESGGARTLTKNGTGQLTLAGNNSYTGATTISEGTLAAGAADVLDNSSGVNLSVSGATLNLAGFNQSLAKLDGVAGAVVTNNAGNSGDTATLTITAGGGSFSGDLTQNGTDALSLVKSGTGSQTLAVVTGTYTGTTTISGGTLSIATDASLGTSAGATTANGGTLNLNGMGVTGGETINISGTGDGGIGALTSTGTAAIEASGSLNLAGDATIGGSGTLTLNTAVAESGGARSLTKTGTSNLVLGNGANSYTGSTTIAQGTVTAAAADVLDNSAGLNLSTSGASFNLAGFDQTLTKLDGVAGTTVTNSTAAVTDAATLTISGNGGVFAGNLTEPGDDVLSFTKSGVGTQTLSGSGNTFSGPVTVSGGVLKAGVANVLGLSSGLNINSAGATFNLAGFDQSLLKLDGVAGAILTNDAGNTGDAATLTITGGGGVFAGDITENGSDTLSITKSTTGTQTLSVGTGSYDGVTTVSGGRLIVTSAASLGSSSGGLVINNAANAGATLELGTPGGTSFADTLTFSGGNNPTLLQSTGGTTTFTGGIVMSSDGTADIAQAGGTLAVTTVGISGAGTLTKTGPGTLQLGVATTLGGLNLAQGVLAIGLANALAASTDLTLAAGTTFNLHGFNQTIASLSGDGIVTNDDAVGASNAAATLTIAAGGGSFTGTISESADDVLSLTKSGTGTQTLASTNSYTGVTTVSGGTLAAGAVDILTSTSGLSITAAGASFNLAGFDQSLSAVSGVAGGIVTNNSTAANDSATLTITGNGGSYAGNITESADDALSFTKSGSGTQTLSGTNTYTGATTVNAGTLQAGAVNILGATSGLTLNGAASTFNLAGFDQQVGKLDGAAGTIVTNSAGNSGDIATLTITGGGGSFAGDITETGSDTLSITKSGSGTQTLSVATGSYDGATSVSGGTLLITTSASLGSASGQTTASTGTLDLGGLALASSETINLTGSGAGGVGALTGTGSVAAGNAIAVTGTGAIGTTATFTVNAAIGGSGTLSKVGSGNLVLSANNSYSGGTSIAAGTLTAGAANVLDNSSGVSVAAGATLNLAGFDQTVTKLDGVATSVVTNDAGGLGDIATLSISGGGGSYAGNLTQNGIDDLSVTKSGTGSQSFAVVSGTYAGATTISGGTLSISTAASLGSLTGNTTANGGTLDISGFTLATGEAISLNGSGNGGAGALTGTGTAAISNALTLTGNAGIGATGTFTVNSVISESGGARSLTKSGAGTVILANGANTYSGATIVAQGTLQAGAVDVLANSSGLNLNASGASFNLAGLDQTIARLDGVAGSIVTNNAVAVGDAATLAISGGGGSYAGDMTESGGDTLALSKSGSGTQTLDVGTGSYNGVTLVTGGTLRVASTASLGTTVGATTANGGTLDAAFTATSGENLVLNGSGDGGAGALMGSNTGTFSGTVSLASAASINVDNGAAGNIDFTLSGNISGAGGNTLTKLGPDTLVLSGNNSYAGDTQIDAGVLKLGAASGVASGSAVHIAVGATFDVNDQAATIGSLGGGGGTLDLGLGSLAASDDVDLTGISVVFAAAGSGNQTLRAGSDGSGSLTVDALSKSSTGNLTLIGPTLIDINGDVAVNAGNLSINNAFSAAGDLVASGNVTLSGLGSLDGAATQSIDAQGGTLTTIGLTKTAGGAGNLSLGGGTAISASGDVAVQTAGGDLLVADNITTDSDLSAAHDVVFQGAGTSTFNAAGVQTITATSGAVRDTAGAVLAKSGGANLVLDAGGAVGVNAGNALGVALTGGSGLELVSGGDVFVTSASSLTIAGLATGAGTDDTVDIRTSGASAALTMSGPYIDVDSDDVTLVAARDLNFDTNPLTVGTLDASFGQSGTSSDFDIDGR
ncbi:MAG: autotransporter-associated beta strand repeat-containing protein [Proteobacteria bacterium]|nr:autotransporter-associated beta strand repeat-containing protein [Pseudomonadota bacterium]